MASLFNSKHNKYVSIPDWFKDIDLNVEQAVEHKTTYVGGGGSVVSTTSGLSNVILYNKFVVEDTELGKEALTVIDTVLNATESETTKIGETTSLSGWNTTDYISVASNSIMIVTSYIDSELNKLYGILFYDNTRSVIGSHLLTSSPEEVKVPANSYYFRISTKATDDFKIIYKVSKEYNADQLLQSNNNITDYLLLNDIIPEGINETSVTDSTLKILVQSPLTLTRDLNNVIKLSMKQNNETNTNDMFVWDKKLAAFGFDITLGQAYSYIDGQQQFDSDGNPIMTNNPDFWLYDENLTDKWIIKSTRPRLSLLDNLFEYDSEKNCFILHSNLATTGGIVAYANTEDINIDDIYDGLPIDYQTLYWEDIKEEVGTDENGDPIYKTTKVLKAKVGSSGDIPDLSNYVTKEDFAPVEENYNLLSETVITHITDIKYIKENYAKLNEDNTFSKANYFNGGLFVNGKQIKYNSDYEYWELEGDLIVSGGITSFASSSGFTPSTIMDAIVCDQQTITIEDVDGVKMLKVIGGSGGSTTASLTIQYENNGNAITALKYENGVLTATKGNTFATDERVTTLAVEVSNYSGAIIKHTGDIQSINASIAGIENNYATKDFVTNEITQKIDGVAYQSWVEDNFVDLLNYQTIPVIKNFEQGIEVNGQLLKYSDDNKCWVMEGDLLVSGGITAYGSESSFIPSTIMDAIVCDEQTITIEEKNGIKMLKVIGGGSSGGITDKITWSEIDGKPTWIGYNKPSYSYSEIDGTPNLNIYALKTELPDLSNYVDITSNQTITGKKDFVDGGLFVNGKEIEYIQMSDSKGYWKLEGDLVVSGGITSFASSSGFTPSTIMDAIVCDEQTITVDVINGVKTLKVIGGGSSNTQEMHSLTIKNSAGITQLTYDPSSQAKTLTLTKSMVGLGNVDNISLSSWEGSSNITTVGIINNGTWNGKPIANKYLVSDTIKIAGLEVSLGGTIQAKTLQTSLDIVTLSDAQEIKGKKNFTDGGLFVNGQQLVYNNDGGYWKMEGNLLVTGGITAYSSDGNATPFLINADTWEDITSDSTTQVYTANATSLLTEKLAATDGKADGLATRISNLKTALEGLSATNVTALVRALQNLDF